IDVAIVLSHARVPCTLHENAWHPGQGAIETLREGIAFPLKAPSLRHREPRSVMPDAEIIAAVRNKYQALRPVLDEKVRRRWAACEAMAIGWGGITVVVEATGLSRPTIRAGLAEVRGGASEAGEASDAGGKRVVAWGRGALGDQLWLT